MFQQHDIFVGRHRVHRVNGGQFRVRFQHAGNFLLGFDHALVGTTGLPVHIGRRIAHLIPERSKKARVAGQHPVKHGRTGALQANNHHRRRDLFIENFRMFCNPGFGAKAIAENIQNALILGEAPNRIQVGLFVQGFNQHFKRLAKRVIAKIAQSGCILGCLQQTADT